MYDPLLNTWLYQSALNIKVRRLTFILRQDAALVPALTLIASIIGYDPSDVMLYSWYIIIDYVNMIVIISSTL